ncbi:MSMEG_6728 family protein [Arthrobacter sp. ISL-30]|uniref:MSMEG_6728 family protein n=1 Tax=Arthrobacter sp. ISL-30 TaxID=2819109 RepID=UPI001BEC124C|nr:MSMEG_6728 family protein [Arthrobacter sp. ISL-30]MBT2515242.1 MSMEG_6728 family protein [Arthrobacter sp. ISL-30]
MQTFLPYADFRQSAAALDPSRLGKQRVETLQILRALVIPDYGWRSHPATRMWMGYVPALTRYGLAMVDEWVQRGGSDSTRANILEFAPDVGARDPDQVPVPPWLGDPDFHLRHRSRLISKSPDFYKDLFPGTPANLEYVWPEPEHVLLPEDPPEPRLWILRADIADPDDSLPDNSLQTISLPQPRLAASPKYRRQLDAFIAMQPGDDVAIPLEGGRRFAVGRIQDGDSAPSYRWRLDEILDRSAFTYPALLQDPRLFFPVPAP